MLTEFPVCRHGEVTKQPLLRHCRSPKLAGLKIVSPPQCEQCYCRDHELSPDDSADTTHLLPCAHLGEPLCPVGIPTPGKIRSGNAHSALSGQFQCCLPQYERTTLDHCQTCQDYLFPLVTPNMPSEMVERLIALPPREQPSLWWQWDNVRAAHRAAATEVIEQIPAWPRRFDGRGIVVVGGGRYFASAYVTIRVLRHLNCQLPIELWHLEGEIDEQMQTLVAEHGVTCVNADLLVRHNPYRFLPAHWWRGWQLKAFALRNCSFREVLLLDSDCYPVRNPEFVFDWPRYREWGAIFWPDLDGNRNLIPEYAWSVFGVEPIAELPTESGQILINKELCWRELNLALHYNAHADFVYRILYGDKDTYPIAWQRLGRRYARMWPHSKFDSVAIRQMDDTGNLLFLHRVHDKFRLPETTFDATPQLSNANQFRPDFPLEGYCFDVLAELRSAMAPQ